MTGCSVIGSLPRAARLLPAGDPGAAVAEVVLDRSKDARFAGPAEPLVPVLLAHRQAGLLERAGRHVAEHRLGALVGGLGLGGVAELEPGVDDLHVARERRRVVLV